ncbi:hypothetical protein ACJMK2_003718 [Sinanodonta woodiana]|uniref:Uncharacterized protein n=1 Tax=Sinanodonta woodiana TaxID=1069815 RepID=A0ABD3XZ31_SINWO
MTTRSIRASVVLLISAMYIRGTDGNSFSVNPIVCKPDHPCATRGYNYAWCNTETSWGYCCQNKCDYYYQNTLGCNSGRYHPFCGNPGTKTSKGNSCRSSHPCGVYDTSYFWCYTDDSDNWEYCCHPGATCTLKDPATGGFACNAGVARDRTLHFGLCTPPA